MEDSTRNDRRRKGASDDDEITILDDAPSISQPPAKRAAATNSHENGMDSGSHSAVTTAREPEPVLPSPEVIQLRELLIASQTRILNLEMEMIHASQQVLNSQKEAIKKDEMYQEAQKEAIKMDEMYKLSQKALHAAQLRADRAEEKLDTKRPFIFDMKSVLEDKVATLTNKLENQEKRNEKKMIHLVAQKDGERNEIKKELEEERKEKLKAYERMDEYKKQLEEEKKEKRRAYERGDEYKKQLEKERRIANERMDDYKKQLEEEKKEKRRAYERGDEYKKQLEEEKKRIDQLMKKLAEYESSPEFESSPEQTPDEADSEGASSNGTVAAKPVIDIDIAHSHNILDLLSPTAKQAISIDEAVEKMKATFEKCGEKTKKGLENKAVLYDCDVCNVVMRNKLVVITHFLSRDHIKKVRSHNAGVSGLALYNWELNMMDQLEEASKR